MLKRQHILFTVYIKSNNYYITTIIIINIIIIKLSSDDAPEKFYSRRVPYCILLDLTETNAQ